MVRAFVFQPMKVLQRILGFTIIFLFCSANSSRERPPVHNPFTAVSDSGKAKFWVNPSDPDAVGTSLCRLSINGKQIWQKRLPFTFEEAQVTDSGIVGGWTNIPEGKLGTVAVVILDAKGTIRLKHKTPRHFARMMHVGPNPKVQGLIFDQLLDRMIVRATGVKEKDFGEKWWSYRLSTAQFTGSQTTPDMKDSRLENAKLIKGTPLILTNWVQFGSRQGQSFTLIDPSGKKVWGQNLVDDFERETSEKSYKYSWKVRERGTILDTSKPGQFEIRMAKLNQRVKYEVTADGRQWKVTEIARRPFDDTDSLKKRIKQISVPKATLPIIGSMTIPQSADFKSTVGDIGEFHFLGPNKIVYVSEAESKAISVIDLQGNLIRSIRLPKSAQSEYCLIFLTKTSGSNFVVVTLPNANDAKAEAWKIDVATGVTIPLPKFKSFWISSIAGFPDGRFAVVSSDMSNNGSAHHLALHAPDGSTTWIKGERWMGNGKDEIFSPEDVDIDVASNIVVLDNITHNIQVFQQSGKFVRYINLDKVWGREASYPTQITCLPNGNMWLLDSGEKPCHLLDRNGKILRRLSLTFANGKAFDSRTDVRVDSKGNPWLTNGRSFFRINEKGLAIQTVGNAPRNEGLGKISDLHVGLDGKVYALDEVTNSVHAFDQMGKRLFAATPRPKEFDDTPNYGGLRVARSGDIIIRGSNNRGDLHFSPKGIRLKDVHSVGWAQHDSEFGVPFQAKPSWLWRGSYLVDEDGKKRATLRRWPDQTWMEDGPTTVAPNGELMSYGTPDSRIFNFQQKKLGFYAANGKPLSQTLLPLGMPDTGSSAFDGKLCCFVTEVGVLAVDRLGKPLWVYTPTNWNSRSEWEVFPSMGRIALYDGKRTVYWIDPSRVILGSARTSLPLSEGAKYVLEDKD